MSDLEELLTQHLMEKAATVEPRHDLDGVRRGDVSPTRVELRAHPTTKRRRWMGPVAVAAAILAIAGVAALGLRSPRPAVEAGGPGSPEPAPGGTGLSVATQGPTPANGFAVIHDVELRLYDGEGHLLGTGAVPEAASWTNVSFTGLVAQPYGDAVMLRPDVAGGRYSAFGLEPGQDCAELDRSAAGVVETCRESEDDIFGRELVLVTPGGSRRSLVGALYPDGVMPGTDQPVAGSWLRARLSPDGAWIAAQWSGECEVQTAYFVRTSDGVVFNTDGTQLGSGSPAESQSSMVLGWNGNRALVMEEQGACSGPGNSTVRSIDPATGEGTVLVDLATADQAAPWQRED
jgi:hypothetical protein